MSQLLDLLQQHWLASTLLAVAVVLGAIALWRWSKKAPVLGWLVAAGTLAFLGAGGLALPENEWSVWLAAGALVLLTLMLAVVILSGYWSALLGYLCGAVLMVGLGGLILPALSVYLAGVGAFLLSLTPLQPWWLILLLLIPLVIWFSFRSLSGLGPVRRWLVIGLRCLGIALLVLALSEAQARQQNENLTVLFLWDQSLSIPPDLDTENIDQREKRIFKFINDAVSKRGPDHRDDKFGLIAFGRWPRLELPPAKVDKLKIQKLNSSIDRTYTDIESAIKLALASFPEGTNKRIVLITDGNQNLGNAEAQVQIAKRNGVQIDVVPLATSRENQQEVVVLGVVAPPETDQDSRLLLRVLIRSYSPNPVPGSLTLTRTSVVKKILEGGKEVSEFDRVQMGDPKEVTLQYGLNTFFFQTPPSEKGKSYLYEAKFTPGKGMLLADRVENNQASTIVVAKGQRAVLLIEPKLGEHKLLVDRLKKAKSSLKITTKEPEQLPQNATDLLVEFSQYDTIILANVAYDRFTPQQVKAIHSNTHDQGCGLIMVGGPNSFGAGGWQGTEVEKALPVTCELKAMKVEGKGGLVLIMHASEIQQGVHWQKKVAQLAVEKLSHADMVGLLYFDFGQGHKWHIPFQQVGPNKAKILTDIDSMFPGDMPDLQPSLKKAYDELMDPKHKLSTKHIIFISDGDHWSPPWQLLKKIKDAKITVTTVCITSHGQNEYRKMADIARATKGNSYPPMEPDGTYKPLDPRQLPMIYIKEARLVSKSFVYDQKFLPLLVKEAGPTAGLPKNLEHLYGFVRTSKRESPLVEVPIWTQKIGKEVFPILAQWQYGLGKAVAFTSDARTVPGAEEKFWDHDWANSNMHGQFWEQVVEWSLRGVETGKNMTMKTEQKDGFIYVTVKVQDNQKIPVTDAQLQLRVTTPSLQTDSGFNPKFEQTKPGVYETKIKAGEVGDFLINVQGKWKDQGDEVGDSVRAGVTIPYSPEFAEMSSNLDLLEKLTSITGGKMYADVSEVLDEVAANGEVFRSLPVQNVSLSPIWPWLVFLAALCLFFDVALRRIAFEPEKLFVWAAAFWARLRGFHVQVATAPQFLDRLQTRKSQIGKEIEKSRAAARFEGSEVPTAALPGAMEIPTEPAKPGQRRPAKPATPGLAPQQKEPEPQDFASRLKKAKQKVWKERDKEK